jgi:hypothetical protein
MLLNAGFVAIKRETTHVLMWLQSVHYCGDLILSKSKRPAHCLLMVTQQAGIYLTDGKTPRSSILLPDIWRNEPVFCWLIYDAMNRYSVDWYMTQWTGILLTDIWRYEPVFCCLINDAMNRYSVDWYKAKNFWYSVDNSWKMPRSGILLTDVIGCANFWYTC